MARTNHDFRSLLCNKNLEDNEVSNKKRQYIPSPIKCYESTIPADGDDKYMKIITTKMEVKFMFILM